MQTQHDIKVYELVKAYEHHREFGKSHEQAEDAVRKSGSSFCDSAQIANAIEIGRTLFMDAN